MSFLDKLEKYLNSGNIPAIILGLPIEKGLFGRHRGKQLRVHPNDHQPPHFHLMQGRQRLGSYSILDGTPIESSNRQANQVVAAWYAQPGNAERARDEWERIYGAIR